MASGSSSDGGRSSSPAAPGLPTTEKRPPRGPDCFLTFCRGVNVLAGLACVLCAVAHGLAVVVGPAFNEDLKLQILRCFGVLISAGLAVVETEWQWLLALVRVLENWIGRGLAQSFLAVFTLQLANSDGSSDFDKSLRLYRNVAGLFLLGCAAFYVLGGVLCIGVLKQVRHRRHMERVRVERDLEALEKQREELHSLLAAYAKV